MKKQTVKILLVTLFIILISIIACENFQGQEINEIRVGINVGAFLPDSNQEVIENAIQNYSWIVNDTEYFIKTTRVKWTDCVEYLNNSNYDVHIIDGVTDEYIGCVRKPTPFDETFREELHKFIYEGGGYIGRCGGAHLPPTYDEEEPDTFYEYHLIKQNSFLYAASDVKNHLKFGSPILSQIAKIRYDRILSPRIGYRFLWDPEAIGAGAYNSYNQSDDAYWGVSLNFTIGERDHAILKGYHGDTIYSNIQLGGSFPNPPSYVSVLASYPEECFDTHPQQKVNIWKFKVGYNIGKILRFLVNIFKDGLIQFLDIDDFPPEWQDNLNDKEPIPTPELIELLTRKIPDWEPTNKIAETEVQNKPAIINPTPPTPVR